MFKKIVMISMIVLLCFPVIDVNAYNGVKHASSSILIESNSGQILYSKNETKKLYPASTTKIMTLILLFEAINKKQLHFQDRLTCSAYAASMGGSQVYLKENEEMTVEELLRCIAIASANDACVVIAENIAGSHGDFVKMMNEKAKTLHLQNTHFKNCTGLHDPQHYTCAYDLSLMAMYLLKIGGQKLLSITSLYDSYVRENTSQKFWLVNTNKLLKQYPGVDGLKTGFTKEAGYCIVTTCKKNGIRLIGVLMKEEQPKVRNQEMIELLNFGFQCYKKKVIYHKNECIDEVKVEDFVCSTIKVISLKDIVYLKYMNDKDDIHTKIKYHPISLPIKKNQEIATLSLIRNGVVIGQYPLYSQNQMKSLSFLQKIIRVYRECL